MSSQNELDPMEEHPTNFKSYLALSAFVLILLWIAGSITVNIVNYCPVDQAQQDMIAKIQQAHLLGAKKQNVVAFFKQQKIPYSKYYGVMGGDGWEAFLNNKVPVPMEQLLSSEKGVECFLKTKSISPVLSVMASIVVLDVLVKVFSFKVSSAAGAATTTLGAGQPQPTIVLPLWATQPWNAAADEPYLKIEAETNALAQSKHLTTALLNRYATLASKNPKDPQAQFRWTYATYAGDSVTPPITQKEWPSTAKFRQCAQSP